MGAIHCLSENQHCVRLLLPFEDMGSYQDYSRTDFPLDLQHKMQAYFAGLLPHGFGLNISQKGTAFQKQVWQAIADIPYGQTRSYGDLAQLLHSHPRAIGQACGKNPLPIIIPCHRVVAKNGLGGFALSADDQHLQIKRFLLQLEGVL
jgi:methylated-DNA-[protein]-cysteine S-methyltransferase